jgi:hypothetical protein
MDKAKVLLILAFGTSIALGINAFQSYKEYRHYDYLDLSLPDYAYRSSKVLKSYKIAVAIPGIVEKARCYCACDEIRDEQFPQGHQNLLHCYIDDHGKFTDHSVYCTICLNEVLDIYKWYKQDVPVKEIVMKIDEKYEGLI